MSWEDKATLDLYTRTAMIYSGATSSDAKKVVQQSIKKDYTQKASNKTGASKWNLMLDEKDLTNDYLVRQMNLDEFTAWDLSSKTGLAEDFKTFSTTIENNFKTSRGTINYNPTKQVTIIDQKENPKTWAQVDKLFPGKLEKDYEVNIIPNLWPNGTPKGESRLVITDKEGEIVEKGDMILSAEQYRMLTGKTEQVRRDAFDASFGEFAQSLPLGSGSTASVTKADDNGARYKRLSAEMYQSPSGALVPFVSKEFTAQVTKDYQDRYQMGEFAYNKLVELENNLYTFKLEPVDGTYAISVYKGDKKVHTDPLEISSFNTEQLSEIKNRSQIFCRNAFLGYIENEALTESTKR